MSSHKNIEPLEIAQDRLMVSREHTRLWQEGFNALRSYGIDFTSLPEFKDTSLLEQADKLPFKRGIQTIMLYWERVSNGIAAAIRRKQMRVVTE